MLLEILKAVGGPGSLGFLALCCVVAAALALAGAKRVARRFALLVITFYFVASLPIVATTVAAQLSSYQPGDNDLAIRGAECIAVLHGDNVRGRVREARRLFQLVYPRLVLVSGEQDFLDRVIEGGVPQDRIVHDHRATNTRQQVEDIARFARAHSCGAPVVIASRLQMPRLARLLDAHGVAARLAPSPIDDEPSTQGVMRFVPMYIGLRVTRDALYEFAALHYYRRQRWIQ